MNGIINEQLDFNAMAVEKLVAKDHPYRKINSMINFDKLIEPLQCIYSKKGAPGEPLVRGFKALLLQHWEKLSYRQLARYIEENIPARWFCGYALDEETPDHSYYCKLRDRIGLEKMSELFNKVIELLQKAGYIGNIFHFVDASSLLSSINLWEARDKAIADRENQIRDEETGKPKMNNSNVSKYSSDPDARFGCKGNKNFWFGYKRHVRVDMRQGFITKTEITSAEVPDSHAFIEKEMCPDSGMIFMDKGYDTDAVNIEIKKRGCANATILKNNRKEKNKRLDNWRSSIRMPYENVFKNLPKYTRLRCKLKIMIQNKFESLAYNLKRLITVNARGVPIFE